MALTPEDVVNKRFNPTKFREGYDQDEVDDFLDEVVVELRRLNQENEELRQRLMAADSRINELQAGGAVAAAPAAAAGPAPVAAPEPVFAPQAVTGDPSDPANTNNLLQLARRLHEEHVREGMEKRDALIAEGHAAAARVVSEAEQAQRTQMTALEQERVALERQVDELRTFEREYRSKLKGYIEGQLRELETSNALEAGSGAAAVPAPQPQQPAAVTAGPAAEQQFAAAPQAAAPAYNGPQSNDYSAFPQPTDAVPSTYPGFAQGS
ncbi:MAG TPA: DivIVA domain-containing protein [Pseudolysinimonas sp.]|nr:DivIVA domain-containing protein [Pseudolysinimonas sp.]